MSGETKHGPSCSGSDAVDRRKFLGAAAMTAGMMFLKPELVRGRRVTVHNNLIGDARAYGAVYTDQDVVVDGDLVTGRTGGHCHLFARQIIEMLANRST